MLSKKKNLKLLNILLWCKLMVLCISKFNMKKKFLIKKCLLIRSLFIAGLICTSISTSLSGSPTKADEEQGWYLTLGGGLAAIQDTEWKWGTYSGELQHSSGFSGEIGLGKDFGRSQQ